MGWGGIEAIRMLEGETEENAVDRAYADGWTLTIGDDDTPELVPSDGPEQDHTLVSADERRWMLDAAAIVEELAPGWEVVSEDTRDGGEWPWSQSLAHPTAQMFVEIDTTAVTFKWVRADNEPADTWNLWWSTLQRFAAYPCAIFHPDEYELIDMTLSVEEADRCYNWFS